ncbi:MAG: hypothetical protein WD184_05735 [Acidimicrobiia bacterium]
MTATRLVRDHPALVGTTVVFAVVVLKVLAVAEFQPGVASAILGYSDTVVVVLGVLTFTVPLMAAFAFVRYMARPLPKDQPARAWELAPAPFYGAAFFYTATVPMLVGLVVGWLSGFAIGRWRRSRDRAGRGSTASITALSIMLFFLAVLVVFGDAMWLSAERIDTADGEHVVGYVLDQGEGWITILIDETRLIVQIRSDDVEARRPCAADSQPRSRTISQIIGGSMGPPGCAGLPPPSGSQDESG